MDNPQDNLRKKESEIGASLHEGVAGKAKAIAGDLSATASQAYDRGAQLAATASDYASDASDTVEGAIRRNPIGSVVAALGVGVLIGLIARR